MDLADWVLAKIPQDQRREWGKIEDAAWEALNLWLTEGIDAAMTKARMGQNRGRRVGGAEPLAHGGNRRRDDEGQRFQA